MSQGVGRGFRLVTVTESWPLGYATGLLYLEQGRRTRTRCGPFAGPQVPVKIFRERQRLVGNPADSVLPEIYAPPPDPPREIPVH